MSNVNRN